MFFKKFIDNLDNKFLFFISLFLIVIQFFIFFFSFQNYPGNKLIYTIFSLFTLCYLIYSLLKSDSFFHVFLSIFIFLGYFWKLSLNLIFNFNNGIFETFSRNLYNANCLNNPCDNLSDQLYDSNLYDNTLIISIIGISGFFISSLVYKVIKRKIIVNSILIPNIFYKKYYFHLIICGLILISIISYINIEYLVFQKGLVSKLNITYINLIFGWILLYGIPTLLTFYLNAEHLRNYKTFFLALNLSHLIHLIINLSLLSRAMIFNAFSNIFAYIKKNQKVNFSKTVLSIIFLLILFLSSIHFVSIKRVNIYSTSSDYYLKVLDQKNISKSSKSMLHLLFNRWVGIEEVLLVENYEDKNFNFFLKSFKDKQSNQAIPLFDLKIMKDYHNLDRTKFNFVSIPGLIAFLHYSNSYILIFLGCFFMSLFFSMIEILSLKISINNLYFTSLIGHLLAYRLIHFGVYPLETYKFLISIFMCLIMHYIMNKIFLKRA